MRPLVIYHGNCPDGFTAAWVAAKALGDVELYAASYNTEPPYDLCPPSRAVYIVDFSYPRAMLEKLREGRRLGHGRVIVLDHHKTAEADLRGLEDCVFDMNRSGAGITWDYFHSSKPRPWIVDYVEDRDLWRFKLPDSEAVGLFIRSAPHTLEDWDAMAQLSVTEALAQANGCKRYLDHYVCDALRQAYVVDIQWADPDEWDDYKAQRITKTACVNVSYTGVSDVLNAALIAYPEAQMALGWHLAADGQLNCSLRSRPDFDCSVFARARKGGGHAQASGFRLPFDLGHGITRQVLGPAIGPNDLWVRHPSFPAPAA